MSGAPLVRAAPAIRRARALAIWRDVVRAVHHHAVFLALVAIAPLSLWCVDRAGLAPGASRAIAVSPLTTALILAIAPYAVVLAVAWKAVVQHRGWPAAWREARSGIASTDRVVGLAITVAGVKVLMVATLGWKVALPAIAPYTYDIALAHWDRVLHLTDPWRLLAPVFGGPIALQALDAAYRAWFVAFPVFVVWQGWRKPSADRSRVLLALALTWVVLAIVVALLVSSAGPVFYERITGLAGPYRDLLSRFTGLPLVATTFQDELWRAYQFGPRSAVAGISAFPSLHVAMPALMACALWRAHRGWAVAMWGYTLVILIGSIMLAWHYALDGEASIILVGLIWWLCGYAVRRPADPAAT